MSSKSGNFVPHTLRRSDGDFIDDTLISVEVESEARVILLDDGTSGFLNGLSTNSLGFVQTRRKNIVRMRCRAI